MRMKTIANAMEDPDPGNGVSPYAKRGTDAKRKNLFPYSRM